MKKIIAVIGARPQFIKHAPIDLVFKKHFEFLSIHTGQHYDDHMSQIFFDQLNISKPDYMLSIGSHSHGVQTAKMMEAIEPILLDQKPDAVLVYGDTNSTLAGALCAAKINIPVIHLGAGLRSFNKKMPEEVNRVLTDHLSSVLLAPTRTAIENLKKEGVINSVFFTGDVMCDMIKIANKIVNAKSKSKSKNYYYVTIHRPYNTDDSSRLQQILGALNGLKFPVIFSRHPRTLHKMRQMNIHDETFENITFIEPVSYFDNVAYIQGANALITDSGGMQKEAYMLKKKCVTIRSETEWTETLENKWNTLVFENIQQLKSTLEEPTGPYEANIYGDGKAAEKIKDIVQEFLKTL